MKLSMILSAWAICALAISAKAQEPDCKKPEYPACSWETDAYLSEPAFAACLQKMEGQSEEIRQYRNCLMDWRDTVIFEVDRRLSEMMAELGAMRQFSKCRLAAGPNATRSDIERCQAPYFLAD